MTNSGSTPRKGFWHIVVIVALVAWGGVGILAISAAAAFVVWRGGSILARATPTPPSTPTRTLPPPPLVTPTARAMRTPIPLPTARHTRAAQPTLSVTPRSRPSSTRPVGAGPTPTPIVCNDPTDPSDLVIAPGQEFTCTFTEDALNQELEAVPDSPCQEAYIALDDGQFTLVCRMGFKMTATGVANVRDCQARLQITHGTPGFTDLVQDMIDTQMALVPNDVVCVEQIEIDDGELTIIGYGK